MAGCAVCNTLSLGESNTRLPIVGDASENVSNWLAHLKRQQDQLQEFLKAYQDAAVTARCDIQSYLKALKDVVNAVERDALTKFDAKVTATAKMCTVATEALEVQRLQLVALALTGVVSLPTFPTAASSFRADDNDISTLKTEAMRGILSKLQDTLLPESEPSTPFAGRVVQTISCYSEAIGNFGCCIAAKQDGRTVAIGHRKTIYFFDVPPKQSSGILRSGRKIVPTQRFELEFVRDVSKMCFNADGSKIVVLDPQKIVEINAHDGQFVRIIGQQLKGNAAEFVGLDVNADVVVTLHKFKFTWRLHVLRYESGELLTNLCLNPATTYEAVCSRSIRLTLDGTHVAIVNPNGGQLTVFALDGTRVNEIVLKSPKFSLFDMCFVSSGEIALTNSQNIYLCAPDGLSILSGLSASGSCCLASAGNTVYSCCLAFNRKLGYLFEVQAIQ